MAAGTPLPQVPPVTKDASDLAGPAWQRWFSLLSSSIKSVIVASQTNQFANGASGPGCYLSPPNAAATDYTTGASPRFVSITLSVDGTGDGGYLTVGGTVVSREALGGANPGYTTLCAIVPANTIYRLTITGLAVLTGWVEL